MGRGRISSFAATLLATFLLADIARARQQDADDSLHSESFDDRMQQFSFWAQTTHGRSLSTAEGPYPVIVPPGNNPPGNNPPGNNPPGNNPPGNNPPGNNPPGNNPPGNNPPGNNPPGNNPPQYGTYPPGPTMGPGCKVLRYATGFANMTLYYNKIIKDSPNFGECCKSCQRDPNCLAWTRVAGGDSDNFRNCYLKYNLTAYDLSPNARDHNHEGHTNDTIRFPELRYVNVDFPTILESGTIPDLYPAEYYGCPYYPGNAGNPCVAPPGCNVNGSGVFIAPPCIE